MLVLPIQGKWYVCEPGLSSVSNRQLAGPFDTDAEAYAAADTIVTRTEQSLPPEQTDTVPFFPMTPQRYDRSRDPATR